VGAGVTGEVVGGSVGGTEIKPMGGIVTEASVVAGDVVARIVGASVVGGGVVSPLGASVLGVCNY
jgi:hypothetical protein